MHCSTHPPLTSGILGMSEAVFRHTYVGSPPQNARTSAHSQCRHYCMYVRTYVRMCVHAVHLLKDRLLGRYYLRFIGIPNGLVLGMLASVNADDCSVEHQIDFKSFD